MYRQILEGLSSAVLLFNQDLKLLYVNPTGEMLFEASAKRLQNMTLDELIISDSSLNDRIRQAFITDHPITEREVNLTLPNLRSIIVDCAITPLTDAPPNRALLVELEQMDRSLRISREENQLAQNNAIRALVRGLAHEVKNPLGGIRGAAQLLERELDDESLREYTSVIIGEADRLRNLVNRMLGPNAVPRKTLLNVHEILEHVQQLVGIQTSDKVHIYTDYDPSIPDLYGDRDQLIQALLNIMGNAAQAVGEQGKITVRTRARRQFTIGHTRYKLVCRIDIIDNGPGIEKEMLEKIFFPMITTRADGTGLGLSIAQSLIQQHDGIIQCKSQPGRTVFSIIIPIKTAETATDQASGISQ
jgi:two-component system nitrogen regulation sensor histidine kinase GlnL